MPQPRAPARIVVVGAGPAGLMAAETIAVRLGAGVAITVLERMPSPARKLLIAGRGGLNLTHSEPLDSFLARYRGGEERLGRLVRAFPPDALRAWAEGLGQETFVGSSGRVFPRVLKASPLLRAWLRRLDGLGVTLRTRCRWMGFDAAGQVLAEGPAGPETFPADAVVLALGGASWPRLGSDGAWVPVLQGLGAGVAQLVPANVGFRVGWSDVFRERFAGSPLKGLAFSAGGLTSRAEAVVTAGGLEGGALYALSADLREACARDGSSLLMLDLKPDWSGERVAERLAAGRPGESTANLLRKAVGLSPVAAALLREGEGGPLPRHPAALAARVKALPLRVLGPEGLDRAISSAGGVRWEELDDHLMLRRRPGLFLAGEMLDWEAPTGGYLLQACFASGVAAGEGVAAWLAGKG